MLHVDTSKPTKGTRAAKSGAQRLSAHGAAPQGPGSMLQRFEGFRFRVRGC